MLLGGHPARFVGPFGDGAEYFGAGTGDTTLQLRDSACASGGLRVGLVMVSGEAAEEAVRRKELVLVLCDWQARTLLVYLVFV